MAPRGVTFDMDGQTESKNDEEMSADEHVQVLRLADAIDPLALGTPEMPTIGSAGHALGACKPCAFLEKGCANGQECNFCHLCPADEKNRRKKEKLAMRRQMCRLQREEAKMSWKAQLPSFQYGAAAMGPSI